MREEERVKVRLTKLHTASLCEQDVTSLDVSVDAVVAVQVNQPLRRAENRERNSQTTSSTTTIVMYMYCVMSVHNGLGRKQVGPPTCIAYAMLAVCVCVCVVRMRVCVMCVRVCVWCVWCVCVCVCGACVCGVCVCSTH